MSIKARDRIMIMNVLLLLLAISFGGCNEQIPETEQSEYTICERTYSKTDFLQLMNGNLVIVGEYCGKSDSSLGMVANLLVNMFLHGIDFSQLSDYDIEFEDGSYIAGIEDTWISFTLFFAEDFGEHSAGEKIPYNVFDMDSWVTNIDISVSFDGIIPDVDYSYNEGPLYDLIDGDVSFSGVSLSGLSISLKAKSELVAFSMDSVNTYQGQEPRTSDTLTLHMSTSRIVLKDMIEQINAGGFGFSYDGTAYHSEYYGIDQTFSDSMIFMKDDGEGWYWEGSYQSKMEKDNAVLYHYGFVSNIEQNSTDFYCDESLTDKIGTSFHDLDLEAGTFRFEDGTEVRYGLEEF